MSRALNNKSRKLRFEALEDRRMLAAFMVDNIFPGSVPGSLGQAIDDANSPANPGLDTITFNLNASDMAQGIEIFNPLLITDDVLITGPSPSNQVKIFGGIGATTGFEFQILSGSSCPGSA